jgi:hypothetical protein
MVNAKVAHSVAEPCAHCLEMATEAMESGRVQAEIGWCGCGTDRTDEMMLAYLRSREVDGFPKPAPDGVHADAVELLAYMADDLGWTEHGGGVGGAWLTDAGREALANLSSESER